MENHLILRFCEYRSNHKNFPLLSQLLPLFELPPIRKNRYVAGDKKGSLEFSFDSGNILTPSKDSYSLRKLAAAETRLPIISTCSTSLPVFYFVWLSLRRCDCFAAVAPHANCNPQGVRRNICLQSSLMFLPFQCFDLEYGYKIAHESSSPKSSSFSGAA